jgi:hypothetical protein
VPAQPRPITARAGALSALRQNGKQWHQLPGHVCGRLGLLSRNRRRPPGPRQLALALVLVLTGGLIGLCCQPAGRAGGFGRWQSRANPCSFANSLARPTSPDREPRRCQLVRLEQNLEGLLSVRFLADGSDPQLGAEQLLFAGVLENGQQPMRCRPDGRCTPHWPTRVVVATVAVARFDERGLATTVPQTLLARGHCELMRGEVRCQAESDEGERWSAQARL